MFFGQPVGLSAVIAGAGHPDGKLIGVVRGVRGGDGGGSVRQDNGRQDNGRQDDDHRGGGQSHRVRGGRRPCRTAGAVTALTAVTYVRRHGRAECYWWRRPCARPPSTPPRSAGLSRHGGAPVIVRRRPDYNYSINVPFFFFFSFFSYDLSSDGTRVFSSITHSSGSVTPLKTQLIRTTICRGPRTNTCAGVALQERKLSTKSLT